MAWLFQTWQALKAFNPLKLARAHVESELEKVESKQTIVDLKRENLALQHEMRVLEQKLQERELALTRKTVVSRPEAAAFSYYSKSPRQALREVEAELQRRAGFQ